MKGRINDHVGEKGVIGKALLRLGVDPNPDVVDVIIGNTLWTRVPPCDECGAKEQPYLIMLGHEQDYDDRTAFVCGECLRKALELANT